MDDATKKMLMQSREQARLLEQFKLPDHVTRQFAELNRISELARGYAFRIPELNEHPALTQIASSLEVARERARELEVLQKSLAIQFKPMSRLLDESQLKRLGLGSEFEKAMEAIRRSTQPLLSEETRRTLQMASESFHARFRMPELGEFARIQQQIDSAVGRLHALRLPNAEIQAAMDAIKSPWVDAARAFESFRDFSSLAAIGKAVRSLPFAPETNRAVRAELGEWDALPAAAIEDSLRREECYLDSGLNAGLIALPEPAFSEALRTTHIETAELFVPDSDVIEFGLEQQQDLSPEELALIKRSGRTCELLVRFEIALRQAIHGLMVKQFGEGWEKSRTPGNGKMFARWTEKRDLAVSKGQDKLNLIEYADFTDYCPLITKRDNWKEVFASVFFEEEDVRVSFRRIEPIRVVAMHARPITKADLLYLGTETTRILTAVGVLKRM